MAERFGGNTEPALRAVMDGTTQAVNSFWEQTSQFGQMPQVAVNGVQRAIADSVQTWLEVHPVVYWLVNHPIWGLILTVTSVFLLWGLLQAVADLTRQFWRMLIRLPFVLGRWLSSQLIRAGVLVVDKARSRLWGQPSSWTDIKKDAEEAGEDADLLGIASQRVVMNHLLGSSTTQVHKIDPAIAHAIESADLDELKPLENGSDIVRLLHRLEVLSQEQNQILRQIAALAEAGAIAKK